MQWVFPNPLVRRHLWFELFRRPLPQHSHEAKVGARMPENVGFLRNLVFLVKVWWM